MNDTITVVGVDPGIVHNGIVGMRFDRTLRTFRRDYEIISSVAVPNANGAIDSRRTADVVMRLVKNYQPDYIFIEEYRPRSNLQYDAKMIALVHDIAAALNNVANGYTQLINNTGSKKILKPALIELLHLKNFPATHHQDLQAAARIMLFGMLKHPELNALLVQLVSEHLDGHPWEYR